MTSEETTRAGVCRQKMHAQLIDIVYILGTCNKHIFY